MTSPGHEKESKLAELVELSRWLGEPERDCVILGEGNTSALLSGDTFLVKASGAQMGAIDKHGFVEVRHSGILEMLEDRSLQGNPTRERLAGAKVDPNQPGMPSVETPLHAVCLGLPGVRYIGHSHPTAINAITCAEDFDQVLSCQLFADQVVACGPRSLRVPFAEPGVELGRQTQLALKTYLDEWGEPPQTIYLRNHGFVALGSSPQQVKALTQMAIKAARIIAGTHCFGGPHAMAGIDKDDIHVPSGG